MREYILAAVLVVIGVTIWLTGMTIMVHFAFKFW